MAEISAGEVAKLRKITGAGLMDCREALTHSGGDFDGAIEFLRKKGQKIANKRSDREAREGCVLAGVTPDGKRGVMVVLNCETDFVAKNEEFVAFTTSILKVAIEKNPASLTDLLALPVGNVSISDAIASKIGAIGEKLELSYYDKIEATQVAFYIHAGNKIATLVGFNKNLTDNQVGKDVAMQVCAMSPVAIDKDDCPKEVVEKEIEIGRDLARQEGKPEAMLEKIAMGKLQKFFNESTLLNQEFVKDNTMNIRQYLQKSDKDLTVTAFRRFSLNA